MAQAASWRDRRRSKWPPLGTSNWPARRCRRSTSRRPERSPHYGRASITAGRTSRRRSNQACLAARASCRRRARRFPTIALRECPGRELPSFVQATPPGPSQMLSALHPRPGLLSGRPTGRRRRRRPIRPWLGRRRVRRPCKRPRPGCQRHAPRHPRNPNLKTRNASGIIPALIELGAAALAMSWPTREAGRTSI
jgi:hypothetical protein